MAYKDLTGKRNGRLVAVEYAGQSPGNRPLWRCVCDCGNEKTIEGRLLGGAYGTRSCGCLWIEANHANMATRRARTKHGDARDGGPAPEYVTWATMKRRCGSPSHSAYKHYGAKGIRVCERWENSYEAFLEDMGRKPFPGASIERKNHLLDYSPGNCRWASSKEQANNTSRNVWVVLRGDPVTAATAAALLHIPARTVYHWAKIDPDITARAQRWLTAAKRP